MIKKTGKIYKLTNEELDLVYIGKTTQDIEERLKQHRRCNSKITSNQLFDGGECKIELLEEININSCEDKIKLTQLEKHYILSTKCVNCSIPFSASVLFTDDRAEYMRQYSKNFYYNNKQKKLDYAKEYNRINYLKVKEYQKLYHQKYRLKKQKEKDLMI
tara:strand:+ start:1972 stop:2451 length:480 start_codon:yes stop_codon:yes gene_type:complete